MYSFIVLLLFFDSQTYHSHSRYMTGDCDFYVYMCTCM